MGQIQTEVAFCGSNVTKHSSRLTCQVDCLLLQQAGGCAQLMAAGPRG